MSDPFWQSPIYRTIKALRDNRETLEAWRSDLLAWAHENPGPDAEAIKAWAPLFAVRSVFTPQELAPLIPALANYLGFAKKTEPVSSKRLEHMLEYARVPRWEKDRRYFVLDRRKGNGKVDDGRAG